MEYAKQNKALREEVEEELADALRSFVLAKAVSDEYAIQEAVVMPSSQITLTASTDNVMSVIVPKFKLHKTQGEDKYPYSYGSVTAELDGSIAILTELMQKLIKLAEIEKTCNMLADEIEKNRRRVNALEYVMIPQTEETIRYITMKLDENERGNTVRLMKIKSILADKQ